MMQKIRVCLRKGHHSVYDDLVRFPPSGVEYVIPKFVTASKNKTIDSLKKFAFQSYLKIFDKPHVVYVNYGNADLIHGCRMLIENNFPWVIDAEHVTSFVGFHAGRLEKIHTKIEKLLASEYCKKIMPWTDAAKQSIINGLDTKGFKDKIEVVYPAMAPVKIERKKHDEINLLFVGAGFFMKGGREVLKAYAMLKKRYDVRLTMISEVPKNIKKLFPDVKFYEPNIPRQILLKQFFPEADIFVLSSYMDPFGMVFLEAMACGIPIVSTNVFAIPEIVGKAGLFIDAGEFSRYGKDYLFTKKSWEWFNNYVQKEKPDIVRGLTKNLSILIENDSLRKNMGLAGRKEIERGKFSIKERNKKLRRIYEEAIKG